MRRLLDLVARLFAWPVARPRRLPLAHAERLGVHIAVSTAAAGRGAPLDFIKH